MRDLGDIYNQIRNDYSGNLIVNPIMTGGILPEAVQRKLIDNGWLKFGYTVCLNCLEGRSGLISKPPIRKFLEDIAVFYGGDSAEHTFASRAAQFSVMKTISDAIKDGSKTFANIVLTDSLCHYTTVIAAEMAGLKIAEAPNEGSPRYRISVDTFQNKLDKIKKDTGKKPALIAITHVEPYHGNLNPVEEIGSIAKDNHIPYMVNAAYTAGIMPVNMKELHADFLTVSAHKSMASLGPLGFLITNSEWAAHSFKKSGISTDWSGRIFPTKIPNIFGCSVGGVPLISAMYSFPHVADRVTEWEKELEKIRWFIKEMETIEGIKLVGQNPHHHHLLHFETPIFWEISQKHKRKGYFLSEELQKKGIVGLKKGLSKHVKMSLYGLNWEQVKLIKDAFNEIVDKYCKNV